MEQTKCGHKRITSVKNFKRSLFKKILKKYKELYSYAIIHVNFKILKF